MAAIGGVDAAILPGLRVDVHATGRRGILCAASWAASPSTSFPQASATRSRRCPTWSSTWAFPAKKVKRLVEVGDAITFGVGFERFGKHMGVSRAFDDKCGVWVITRVLEELAAGRRRAGRLSRAACTVQEEIGTRGAITSAFGVAPDVAVAFDVTHATDYPGISHAKFGDIKCGGGPVIGRGPERQPVGVRASRRPRPRRRASRTRSRPLPGHSGTDAWPIQVVACRHPHGPGVRAAALHAHAHRGHLPGRP